MLLEDPGLLERSSGTVVPSRTSVKHEGAAKNTLDLDPFICVPNASPIKSQANNLASEASCHDVLYLEQVRLAITFSMCEIATLTVHLTR